MVADMSWLPRLIGLATAGYSVAIMVRPELFAGPCKLTDEAGRVPRQVRTLVTAIGARDLASGLALALAPAGRPMRLALATRVACDLGDAVFLAAGVPDAEARKKVVAVAGGWAALTALSALTARGSAR